MMRIGLIGGIGPAATMTYYRELVCRYAVAGRELPLTIVNADVGIMTANLAAGRAAEQAAIFARLIDRLRDGGCELAAVTSMGGHFCINELKTRSSLPLIDAVKALARHLTAGGYRRVGVLGTRAVMKSKLYGMGAAEVVSPVDDELDLVGDAYVAVAKAGAATAEQSAIFRDAAARLIREQSVEAIVLGGTDLSVAFGAADATCPVVDSALVHAAAIADAAA